MDMLGVDVTSYAGLRDRLREGFNQLLSFLPSTDEPTIQMGYYKGDRLVPFASGERTPLGLLEDFVRGVRSLGGGGAIRPPERVREILVEKGVAQMIVSGDERWHQFYVD